MPHETKLKHLWNKLIPSMATLTSIDYARLIQLTATNLYHTLLNKTQVNKILFYIYGAYLADNKKPPFTDDTPKAWTYGPVFPIPNKVVVSCEMVDKSFFLPAKIEEFQKDQKTLNLVMNVVKNMCNKTAYALTQWSHTEGSPWYKTIYKKVDGVVTEQKPWNTRIENSLIADYFSDSQNRIFDGKK